MVAREKDVMSLAAAVTAEIELDVCEGDVACVCDECWVVCAFVERGESGDGEVRYEKDTAVV